jgi:prevent-host-death family protein
MDVRTSEFGTTDAKARFSELLARAEAGETITIRRHGKAVARIVPAASALTEAEKLRRIDEFLEWRRENGPRLEQGDSIKDWINEGRR